MDIVFKALSDPTRRAILDALHSHDGQTVTQLEAIFDMTRFGVMRHLTVLEEAGLVVSRKRGRFKHIHLNAAPLQEVVDRWMEPMVRPWARRIIDIKHQLEEETDMNVLASTQSAETFVLQTYIRTTSARLWQAITDPADTTNYYFGTAVKSDFTVGSAIDYLTPDGNAILTGKVLEVEPEKRLVTTFRALWMEGAPETQVTYEIEMVGDMCKLTLTHEGLTPEMAGVKDGWSRIAAGLKSLIETGEALVFPQE